MKNIRLLLAVVVLSPLTGCEWLRSIRDPDSRPPKGSGPLPQAQPEQFVGYINERSARVQSLNFGDVRLVARAQSIPLPPLRGNMAASQPRNFRMSAIGGAMGGKVDLGSNTEQFWMFLDVPTEKQPLFVYASHSDFEAGKARIPGGIPFEPDWVMQALGMTTLPTTLPPGDQYSVKADDKTRTYTLSWPAKTPGGARIIKEIVFAGDAAADPRPQVKKHVIRDERTNKVICSAEIKEAKTIPLPIGPSGQPQVVQHPTVVVLRWEEQKFEMELDLKAGKVNEPFTAEETGRLFRMPAKAGGVSPIDLARADFPIK